MKIVNSILGIKFQYNLAVCKLYLDTGLLSDAYKLKHPKIYEIADRRWRYHAHECLEVLHRQNAPICKELRKMR